MNNVHYDIVQIKYKNIYNDEYEMVWVQLCEHQPVMLIAVGMNDLR